jgi:hypothetical protein
MAAPLNHRSGRQGRFDVEMDVSTHYPALSSMRTCTHTHMYIYYIHSYTHACFPSLPPSLPLQNIAAKQSESRPEGLDDPSGSYHLLRCVPVTLPSTPHASDTEENDATPQMRRDAAQGFATQGCVGKAQGCVDEELAAEGDMPISGQKRFSSGEVKERHPEGLDGGMDEELAAEGDMLMSGHKRFSSGEVKERRPEGLEEPPTDTFTESTKETRKYPKAPRKYPFSKTCAPVVSSRQNHSGLFHNALKG